MAKIECSKKIGKFAGDEGLTNMAYNYCRFPDAHPTNVVVGSSLSPNGHVGYRVQDYAAIR